MTPPKRAASNFLHFQRREFPLFHLLLINTLTSDNLQLTGNHYLGQLPSKSVFLGTAQLGD